jgi:hypothetical protein
LKLDFLSTQGKDLTYRFWKRTSKLFRANFDLHCMTQVPHFE